MVPERERKRTPKHHNNFSVSVPHVYGYIVCECDCSTGVTPRARSLVVPFAHFFSEWKFSVPDEERNAIVDLGSLSELSTITHLSCLADIVYIWQVC